jgi:hypothetical protein
LAEIEEGFIAQKSRDGAEILSTWPGAPENGAEEKAGPPRSE